MHTDGGDIYGGDTYDRDAYGWTKLFGCEPAGPRGGFVFCADGY